MPSLIDLTGKRFGRLVVKGRAPDKGDARVRWICKCECGNDAIARSDHLKRPEHLHSCGCYHEQWLRESSNKIATVKLSHGMSGTPEHRAYKAARQRTVNPRFVRWHGRGIKFLFDSFESFFAEVGPKPSPKHSIDRWPNNDGHYEPGNVRWATAKQQANNRRKRKIK